MPPSYIVTDSRTLLCFIRVTRLSTNKFASSFEKMCSLELYAFKVHPGSIDEKRVHSGLVVRAVLLSMPPSHCWTSEVVTLRQFSGLVCYGTFLFSTSTFSTSFKKMYDMRYSR